MDVGVFIRSKTRLRTWLLVPPVVLALVGIGGSFVKPCILGTAQKSAGSRATLAFSIFYMVVNIGSIVGRFVAFFVRRGKPLSLIFAVATTAPIAPRRSYWIRRRIASWNYAATGAATTRRTGIG